MLPEANLKKPVQLIGQLQIREQPMKRVLQPWRVATVTAMGRTIHSSALEATVTGGVLRRAQLCRAPGAGAWATLALM